MLATLYAVFVWAPVRRLNLYPLSFVPLVWIVLSRGLPGAAVAVLGINLCTYLGLCIAGASPTLAANCLLLSIAVATVGLGLGTAVMLRDQAESALKQSREHLAQVLTGARLGLWNSDLKAGRVTYDRRYAEMLGYASGRFRPTGPGGTRAFTPTSARGSAPFSTTISPAGAPTTRRTTGCGRAREDGSGFIPAAR